MRKEGKPLYPGQNPSWTRGEGGSWLGTGPEGPKLEYKVSTLKNVSPNMKIMMPDKTVRLVLLLILFINEVSVSI